MGQRYEAAEVREAEDVLVCCTSFDDEEENGEPLSAAVNLPSPYPLQVKIACVLGHNRNKNFCIDVLDRVPMRQRPIHTENTRFSQSPYYLWVMP